MTSKELLQVISILMQYPSQENVQFIQFDLEEIVNDEVGITYYPEVLQHLRDFKKKTSPYSLEDLQDLYVRTFDFSEKTNLYLTYSKLKEEKERGRRLVELKQAYIKAGFIMDTEEMPDYFPLFIEFITIANEEVANHLIRQFETTILVLKNELQAINSPYTKLIEAYIALTKNGSILLNREVE